MLTFSINWNDFLEKYLQLLGNFIAHSLGKKKGELKYSSPHAEIKTAAEAYSVKHLKMELFAKIVIENFSQGSILDVWMDSDYASGLSWWKTNFINKLSYKFNVKCQFSKLINSFKTNVKLIKKPVRDLHLCEWSNRS